MPSASELKRPPTIEGLLSVAVKVDIRYKDGGQLERGWFELDGEGRPELEELIQRFGQQGIDAFNRAFITRSFGRELKKRTERLTQSIVDFASEDDAPDISWMRGGLDASREGLRDLLKEIREGKEVPVLLGGKKPSSYYEQGFRYGQFPPKDAITIKLKKPTPRTRVAQPNL